MKFAVAILTIFSVIGCGSGETVEEKDDIGKTPGLTIGPQTPKNGAPPKTDDKADTK